MKKIVISVLGILMLVLALLPATAISVSAATTTLNPNTYGSYTTLQRSGSYANWNACSSDDSDSSYVYYNYDNNWHYDVYNIADPSASGTINSVTVYIKARATTNPSRASAQTVIRTNSNYYYGGTATSVGSGTTYTLTTSYDTYSTTYATNPYTGSAWSWSDINNLQAGVALRTPTTSTSYYSRCTYVYVVVDYAIPLTVTINQASGQADPTYSSPIHFTVVFSASTTDFATGDVSLSGTAGASNAVVTGSGTTYDVAVSGMTTSGTVIASINAGVAHDGSGTLNSASTSTDHTVTYTYTTPNPTLSDTCGLDIVLVMDESTSIDSTEFNQMKQAFKDFVDAFLPKTPTQFALVDFSTDAVIRLGFTDNVTSIKAAIDGARLTGWTNWQQGLLKAQSLFPGRSGHPDLIVFASDGDPTAYSYPAVTNVSASVALPYAITVANSIKSAGIRIVTIGIGSDVITDNLVAISGSVVSPPAVITKDTDVILGSFSTLADILSDLSCELCGGTITIHKVIDADGNLGTTGDQTTTGTTVTGWTYSLAVTGGTATPTSGATDSTGTTVAFDIAIPGTTATVAVTETVKDGYDPFAAVCTGASTNGTYNDATNSVTGIVVGKLDIVSITFYNTPALDCTITLDTDAADGTVCASSTGHTATVADAGTGATYTWTVTGGTITGGQGTRSITFNAGTGSSLTVGVTVTKSGVTPCSSGQTIIVQSIPICTISLNLNSSSGSAVCASSTGHTATVANAGAGATYAWTVSGGSITAGQNTPSITFSAGSTPGTLTVNVTVTTSGGCSCTSSSSITIQGTPDCEITLTLNSLSGSAVCANSAGHTASVTAVSGATYAWTITGGTITAGQGTNAITFSAGSTPGTLTVGVTITTTAGCTCNSSESVTIQGTPDCEITLTLNSLSDTAVCASSTGHTASVTAVSGAGYVWTVTGGTITAGQGTNSITFSAGTGSSLTVGVTITTTAGCTCNSSQPVTIQSPPNCTITLDTDSQDGTVCASSTGHTATVATVSGGSYAWTITGGSITAGQGTNTITFSAGASGSVTVGVTVTTSAGCTCTNSQPITIAPNPDCTITLDTDSQDGVAEYTTGHTATVATISGATYLWTLTGNGTITAGQGTHSITFSAGAVGTIYIKVEITTLQGCYCTRTVTVIVGNAPDCTITLDDDSEDGKVCEDSTGHSASVPALAGATYLWTLTGDYTNLVGSTTHSITFDATAHSTGNINVKVEVTTLQSAYCTSNVDILVGSVPNCNITLTLNSLSGSAVCVNSTGHTASVATVSGASYVWTITGGTITAGQGTHAITFSAGATPGNLTVGVTVTTTAGCTCENSQTITIQGQPNCNITLNLNSLSSTAVCANSTGHTASVATVSGATYVWTITGGTITSGQNTHAITFSAGATPGTLTVGVTVTTTAGCTCSNSRSVTIQGAPDCTITLTLNSLSGSAVCASTTGHTASVTAVSGASYVWTITGGTITSGQNTHAITFSAGATPGNLTVGVTITTSAGCTCSSSQIITIQSPPNCTITLTLNSESSTAVCASSSDHIATVAAVSGASYVWTITGGTITAGQGTNSITFDSGATPSNLTVGVTVTTTAGCTCSSSKTITIQSPPDCTVSLDGDPGNDTVCAYSYNHTAAVASAGAGASYSWSVTGSYENLNVTDNSITFDATDPGTINIHVDVTDANGCTCSSDKEVNVEDSPDCGPTADAGPDQTVDEGNSAPAGGAPTGSGGTPGYTYSWWPTTGVSDPTTPNPSVTPGSTTTYTVTVCDSRGRCDSDSMTVTVTSGPPYNPPGDGGGGFSAPQCYLIIDMLGKRTTVAMDCCENCTLEPAEAYDPSYEHLLELRYNTEILCGDCEGECSCYPRLIVMSPSDETVSPPEGMAIVGPVYDFTGYVDTRRQIECQLATYFDPAAAIALDYDPGLLPEGASNPVVAFYSHDRERWVILPPDTGRVAEVGVVTGMAEYFASPFAVLVTLPGVEPPPPPVLGPAHFTASGLSITPIKIDSGDNVTISVDITNDGEQSGTYNAQLQINGTVVNSQNVTLGVGQTQTVSFSYTETESGRYEAMVAGLTGIFNVVKPFNWWILIIAGGALLLGFLIWRYRKQIGALFKRRRRKKPAYAPEEPPYVEPEAGTYPKAETEPRPGAYPYPAAGMGFDTQPAPQSEVDIYPYPYPAQGSLEPQPPSGPEANPHPNPAGPEVDSSAPEAGILFPYPIEMETETRPSIEPEASLPPTTGPEVKTPPEPMAEKRLPAEAGTSLQPPQPSAGTKFETQSTPEPEAKVDTQPARKTRTGTLPYTFPYLYPSPELESDTLPSPDEEVSLYPYLYPSPALEAEIQSKPEAEVETLEPETKAKPVTELETNPMYPYPYPAAGTDADTAPELEAKDSVEPENLKPEPAPEANPYLYPYPFPAAGMEENGPTDTKA